MADWVLSVAQLNDYVRLKLAGDPMLNKLSVRGEVSGFREHYASGHWYFTLKDDASRIQCVMYRTYNRQLKAPLKDGQRIIVTGQASLYVPSGQYQLYVSAVETEGKGDLYARFEELKARLMQEGLFDASVKKPLPATVRTIGVATSMSGAVLRDIVRVARARNPKVNILIAPCSVQGKGAENEIASAIKRLDESGRCDVILVGRGGGSVEDLWPFNEEVTARAIYACRTPIVSCVGHETDFSIADFTADVRAATPSNAAELAVNDVKKQQEALFALRVRLNNAMHSAQKLRRLALEGALRLTLFKNPREVLIEKRFKTLEDSFAHLKAAEVQLTERARTRLEAEKRLLSSLNPDNIKRRGYAVVRKGGAVISALEDIKRGDGITVELADGALLADVTEVMENG